MLNRDLTKTEVQVCVSVGACVCMSASLVPPPLSLFHYLSIIIIAPLPHHIFSLPVNLLPFFPFNPLFIFTPNTTPASFHPWLLLISICHYLPLHLFSPSLLHSCCICRITTCPPNCPYILSPLHGCYYHHVTFYFSHGVIRSLPVFSLMQLQCWFVVIPPTHLLYLSHEEQISLCLSSSLLPFLAHTVSPLSNSLRKWNCS